MAFERLFKKTTVSEDQSLDWIKAKNISAAVQNADVDQLTELNTSGLDSDFLNEALYYAAKLGHGDFVKKCLVLGADPNFKDSCDEETVLSVACLEGHADVVRVLLQSGCDINLKSRGRYPLAIAVYKKRVDVITAFVEAGCDIHCPLWELERQQPIQIAICKGDRAVLETLIKALKTTDFDINAHFLIPSGITPLMLAAQNGQHNIVKVLLDAGGDTEVLAAMGHTALFIAAGLGHTECMRVLLLGGADVDAHSQPSPTPPLHWAILCGQQEAVILLIQAGCHVDIQANYAHEYPYYFRQRSLKTAMEVAEDQGATWAMSLLLEAGSHCLAPVQKIQHMDGKTARLLAEAIWLQENPDSLRNQSRRFIRKRLGKYLLLNVHKLYLPGYLVDFLMYSYLEY